MKCGSCVSRNQFYQRHPRGRPRIRRRDRMIQMFGQRWMQYAADRLKWSKGGLVRKEWEARTNSVRVRGQLPAPLE